MRWGWPVLLSLGLAACASHPVTVTKTRPGQKPAEPPKKVSPYPPAQEDPGKRGDYVAGGLFRPNEADSTPDHVPDVDAIPEPDVTDEPRSRFGNRPSYTVLGKTYQVREHARGYVEQGIASYYGQKFHGRRTSNMEVYDMYAFSAAHKTLPLPSFARVTNLENGRSVVVRVNDRGPFHAGRLIDLSYAAAVKIGIYPRGSGRVEVRALTPGEDDTARTVATAAPSPAPVSVDALPAEAPSATVSALAAAPVAAPAAGTGSLAGSAAEAAPLTVQVASFSAQANAERALQRLRAAGIQPARLHDAQGPDGRTLWRLRVGPLAAGAAGDLVERLPALGFPEPRYVRE